jgi:hypothetical protein
MFRERRYSEQELRKEAGIPEFIKWFFCFLTYYFRRVGYLYKLWPCRNGLSFIGGICMKGKAIIVGIMFFAFGLLLTVSRGTALVRPESGEMQIVQAEEAAHAAGILGHEADEYEDANTGEAPRAEELEIEEDEYDYQWPEEEPQGQDNYEYLVPEDIIPEEDSNR